MFTLALLIAIPFAILGTLLIIGEIFGKKTREF
nr:MAG TPA: PufQ cytochrome subunit [Caudoviricetes sp.]